MRRVMVGLHTHSSTGHCLFAQPRYSSDICIVLKPVMTQGLRWVGLADWALSSWVVPGKIPPWLQGPSFAPSSSPAFFKASSRCLFLFPMIRRVAFFSISAILSQFEMRLIVQSTLTTIGPRWSSCTVVPPLLRSSFVVSDDASGRARGAFGVSLGASLVSFASGVLQE